MSTIHLTCQGCGKQWDERLAAGGRAFAACPDCGKIAASVVGRIDYDVPTGDEVYVIRVEHATAGRLKATITQAELDACGFTAPELIAAKAEGLASIFERRPAGKEPA